MTNQEHNYCLQSSDVTLKRQNDQLIESLSDPGQSPTSRKGVSHTEKHVEVFFDKIGERKADQ